MLGFFSFSCSCLCSCSPATTGGKLEQMAVLEAQIRASISNANNSMFATAPPTVPPAVAAGVAAASANGIGGAVTPAVTKKAKDHTLRCVTRVAV